MLSRAGEETQSLSRFVGAQRLAFVKLLKKYKRWTGSQSLSEKVEKELLGRPSSFSRQTFEPLLAAWTIALVSVRAPFTPGGTRHIISNGEDGSAPLTRRTPDTGDCLNRGETGQTKTTPLELSSSVAQLHNAAEVGTGLDLDAALATVPLCPSAGTAAYWVHPDDVIELQVLLLKHMRLESQRRSAYSSNHPSSSDQSSERVANSYEDTRSIQTDDIIGFTVLDKVERFINRQSGVVMSEKNLQNAAATIRHSSSGEAILVVRASAESVGQESQSRSPLYQKTKMKRKHLESLFDPCMSRMSIHEPSEAEPAISKQRTYSAQDLGSIREWFAQNSDVRPLVDLQYRRTRFIGVGNKITCGFWATLDRDIKMEKVCSGQRGTLNNAPLSTDCDNERLDAVQFPYAVLDIRWEDSKGYSLAEALDKSHLVSCPVGT